MEQKPRAIIKEHITLTNLTHTQKRDLTDLLWVTNPEYEKKLRMGFWLGKTPKKLDLYITNQQALIIPYGLKGYVKEHLTTEIEESHNSLPIVLKEKNNLSLYPYQENAVKQVLRYNNGILISPAGSGKTRMAMKIIKKRSVKTLWITHTLDLLNQSKKVFKHFFENKAGTIAGGKVDIQDITFATVQTLHNLDLPKYKDMWELIIVDEVHRVGGTPNRATMFYKVLSNLNARYKYGVTATLYPKKNDIANIPLYMIGDIRHEVKEKDIKRIKAKHIPILLDTEESIVFLNPDKTINYNELLSYLTYNQARNNRIVDELIKVRKRHNIVLSNRNAHLEIISSMLDYYGIPNKVLVGDVKTKDREKIIEDFKLGKFRFILSNYQLTKEGLDLPIADTLHLIMPMRDKTTIVQSKGRIERVYNGKNEALVYDYVDRHIGMLFNMYVDRRRIIK